MHAAPSEGNDRELGMGVDDIHLRNLQLFLRHSRTGG